MQTGAGGVALVPKSLEERKSMLMQAVMREVQYGGARVEMQADLMAIMVYGQKVNHVLHFLIAFFTCGLWAIVWVILALSGGESRKTLSVDEYGRVQKL